MGCDAYGLSIKTSHGDFDIFKSTPILVGHTDYKKCIEQSTCQNFALIRGSFATYILDIENQSVSTYKVTIRGLDNAWSEEQAIYGKSKMHINGFSRPYYLQYPFVKKQLFHQTFEKYEELRRKQIEEAVNALEQNYQ